MPLTNVVCLNLNEPCSKFKEKNVLTPELDVGIHLSPFGFRSQSADVLREHRLVKIKRNAITGLDDLP